MKKIIEIIKKNWLVKNSMTAILVIILIVAFLALNFGIRSLNLTAIDVTGEKLFTLSEESKKQIQQVQDEVTIYFVGYKEDTANVDLAKQYTKANEKIKVEVIEDITANPQLQNKYQLTTSDVVIIVQGKDRNKMLTEEDLYSYDYTTNETDNLAEQKMTNAIIDVTVSGKPKIYFLAGHNEYMVDTNPSANGTTMVILQAYLTNEIFESQSIDLLVTKTIPEDCDVLVIASPQQDYMDAEVEEITKYINNGGNILFMSDVLYGVTDYRAELPNVQKILDLYGVTFEMGIAMEQDTARTFLQTPNIIIPMLSSNQSILKDMSTNGRVTFMNACKLKFEEGEKLTELKVTKNDLVSTSDKAYFRTNLLNGDTAKSSEDQEGSFILGSELTKEVNDGKKSRLIIFSDAIFVSDAQIAINQQGVSAIQLYNNKDLVLNSLASLADREDAITIRKLTGTVRYTATQQQDFIIKIAIFAVPILIIIIGVVIWQLRRRKS